MTGGIIFAALGAFLFIFFNKGDGIKLEFDIPKSVSVGIPTEVSVVLQNNSKTVLNNASIELILPSGVVFESNESQLRAMRDRAVIDVGETAKETFSVIVKDKSLDRVLRAEALYTPENLGQKLRLTATKEVVVETPIDISVSSPKTVKAGERFDWSVDLKNKSDREWTVMLEAEVPDEVVTNFGEEEVILPVGSTKKRTFSGSATLEEGQEKWITVRAVKVNGSNGQKTVLAEQDFSIVGDKSNLGISANLNGETGMIVVSGAELQYNITISNTGTEKISDIVVSNTLDSKMIDLNTISGEGMIISNNKISWNKNVSKKLESLLPGEKVDLSFFVNAKEVFVMKNYGDKNYPLKATIRAEGINEEGNKIINVFSLENKIAGEVNLTQKLLYRDALSGIVNTGPFPPKVGQATEYIMRLNLVGVGADMENVTVRVKPAPGVRATGKNKVSVGELKEKDGYLIWTIDKLPAGTGVIKDNPQAIIQLSYLPSISDAEKYGPVITETTVSADDIYTERKYENYFGELTTELKDDLTVKSGDGIIRQ